MKVLHLHRMGDPRHYRESVRTLEHMFASASDADCIVHDADLPLPEWVRAIDFDLYILGPTFLCCRYSPADLTWAKRSYGFVADRSGFKVALPQDDYDCSAILDDWMEEWAVDVVYSVLPEDTWPVLYEKCAPAGRLRLGYTGYISQQWLDTWKVVKPSVQRAIDVSYRATRLPPNFGSLGQLKADIADRFLRSVPAQALVFDISVAPEKTIPGKQWHHFVENSRACLVTPSGSSLLDPVGRIRTAVNGYLRVKPTATFSEVEAACFPGEDSRRTFSAISPRNIEAALAGTVQIAVPGDYSGILKAGQHYIPLNADCGNIAEVLDVLRNPDLMYTLQHECRNAILAEGRLRSDNMVEEVVALAAQRQPRTSGEKRRGTAGKVAERYLNWSEGFSRRYWERRRLLRSGKHLIRQAGTRATSLMKSVLRSQ